jgi:hypothetical protein
MTKTSKNLFESTGNWPENKCNYGRSDEVSGVQLGTIVKSSACRVAQKIERD